MAGLPFLHPDAHQLRTLHTWGGWAWLVLGLPLGWFITYRMEEPHAAYAIIAISLWANAATHWGAAGAARAEEQAKEKS